MKKLLILIFFSLLLNSCSLFSKDNTSMKNDGVSNEIQHSYSEIKNKKLAWNYLFFDSDTPYYVYCYSLTCSHCNKIKNKVIEHALQNDNFYFYEDSSLTCFSDEIDKTIGVNDIKYLFIKGFPSLLKIEEKKLLKNLCGEDAIINELIL